MEANLLCKLIFLQFKDIFKSGMTGSKAQDWNYGDFNKPSDYFLWGINDNLQWSAYICFHKILSTLNLIVFISFW